MLKAAIPFSFVPGGTRFPVARNPSDESLGYSLSPCRTGECQRNATASVLARQPLKSWQPNSPASNSCWRMQRRPPSSPAQRNDHGLRVGVDARRLEQDPTAEGQFLHHAGTGQ
jgi:hypothetical protein